jgi:hypothetical protein
MNYWVRFGAVDIASVPSYRLIGRLGLIIVEGENCWLELDISRALIRSSCPVLPLKELRHFQSRTRGMATEGMSITSAKAK